MSSNKTPIIQAILSLPKACRDRALDDVAVSTRAAASSITDELRGAGRISSTRVHELRKAIAAGGSRRTLLGEHPLHERRGVLAHDAVPEAAIGRTFTASATTPPLQRAGGDTGHFGGLGSGQGQGLN